jgi:hypothetical protein
MRTLHALTGALLLCFVTSTSVCIAQTKNAATDKQRQENLDKLQKKQAKQRAAYNKMSDEQKAVARKKALERKTGKSTNSKPVIKTGSSPGKPGTINKSGAIKTKPANVSKGLKPSPVFKTSKVNSKASEPVKPAIKSNAAKKPVQASKPIMIKPAVKTKSPADATKETSAGKDKK